MKIKIKINEGQGCGDKSCPACHGNTHNDEEARMHRTTLAHLMADVKVLLSLIEDEDDLPEWLETKITKAGDYMSSAARYIAGGEAREQGQLEEQAEDEALMRYAIDALKRMSPQELQQLIDDHPPEETETLEEKKSSRCTKVTKKTSSSRKGKKWMKCVKSDSGGYKRIHWGQAGVRVTGKSGNTKRKKSFKARHGCSKAKSNTPKGQACKDWAEE